MSKRREPKPNIAMYKGQRGLAPVQAPREKDVYAAQYLSLLVPNEGEARIWNIPGNAGYRLRGVMALRAGGQLTIYDVYATNFVNDTEIEEKIAAFWMHPVMFEIYPQGGENGN